MASTRPALRRLDRCCLPAAYACFARPSVFKAPLFDIGLQAVVQGLLTAIVALLLYGHVVSLLGAGGAAFVALNPLSLALWLLRFSWNGLLQPIGLQSF
jgi:hypothetical protein